MSKSPKNDRDKNEGEGNRTADRRYREQAKQHAESGASEPAAEEAQRALEGTEGEELRRAEKTGKAAGKHRTVQDVMTPSPVALPETTSLIDAARKMRDAGIGNVVVLDGETVCGIVTDRDIVVRGIANGCDPRATSLADVCSRHVTTLSPSDPIATASRVMREHAIRRLPVVEGGRPVGILSLGDLAMHEDRESALADVSAAPPNV